MLPISDASCRHASTAPVRSRPHRRAPGSVRSTEPARPERPHSTSGLGTGRRSARSASPDHATRCCHCGCRSPSRWRGDGGRTGLFDHGVTAALRRECCGPAVTRTRRSFLRSAEAAVTRRWKACNPVVKDQHPSSASTSALGVTRARWVSQFTPLHPLRPTARLPLRRSLPEGHAPDEPLVLLDPPRMDGLAATAIAEAPRRLTGPAA
jgi:hypothetical protein